MLCDMHSDLNGPWFIKCTCPVCQSIEQRDRINDAIEHIDDLAKGREETAGLLHIRDILDPPKRDHRNRSPAEGEDPDDLYSGPIGACPQCGSNLAYAGKCDGCGYHDGMLSQPHGDKL